MTLSSLRKHLCLTVALLSVYSPLAFGQVPVLIPPSTPYGLPISIENAKKAATAALANLVYFERMDNVQNASPTVAVDKANSAAIYKRPTKAFLDALAAGGVEIDGSGTRSSRRSSKS